MLTEGDRQMSKIYTILCTRETNSVWQKMCYLKKILSDPPPPSWLENA